MRTKLMLCAIVAFSALLGACEDNRTADFCATVCDCAGDDNNVDACTGQCTQSIDVLESSNAGAPIVSDECFSCASHTTCQIIAVSCNRECATLFEALNNTPQPGDPIDPPTN